MLEIKGILCPVDFFEFSVSAYRHALSLAEHHRAKLVAQHIAEPWHHPRVSFVVSAELYDKYIQELREMAEKQLQEFVKNHTHGTIQPELVVSVGMLRTQFCHLGKSRTRTLSFMERQGF